MKRMFIASVIVVITLSGFLTSPDVFGQDCGPSGGKGGNHFTDGPISPYTYKIAEIRIWSGKFIDAIQVVYRYSAVTNQPPLNKNKHGGSGGSLSVFKLDPDEQIVSVGGKYGDYIDSFWIKTNKGRSKKWGGNGGSIVFYYAAPKGFLINSFFGQSGSYLDAIGVNFEYIQ